jgi:hypothetical protein
MKVAVICETSGKVREAFRARGHIAWSCDILPADDGSQHHCTMDAVEFLNRIPDGWLDLIIMHPPCTALAVSGNHVYAAGKPRHGERLRAAQWTYDLWELAKRKAHRVALENPQGVLCTLTTIPKPQFIQPYDFGHDASKKTGLHLHNLPPLQPTLGVTGRMVNGVQRWSNQTDSGQNRLGPSEDRWKLRSETYQGIADAMADQWGAL